jgi:hypothetical protein
MTELKRDLVKYVRDRAKARYDKGDSCEICGESENLDFHHYHSMSPLLHGWLKKNRLNPTTADEIMAVRDQFIELHNNELFVATVTLCHTHHLKLHSVYGKDPALGTASKQANWVKIQREKNGLV